MIKERLKSKGVSDITSKELEGYFSPWHAKHIGQIKVLNRNNTLDFTLKLYVTVSKII